MRADIQVHHDVRPDSMIILRAAQEVVSQPGFDDMLDETRDRVDEIEGMCFGSRFFQRLVMGAMGAL